MQQEQGTLDQELFGDGPQPTKSQASELGLSDDDSSLEEHYVGDQDELPCGYIDEAGVLHKNIVIEEMTGIDEDTLANENLARSGSAIDEVMSNVVAKLGPIDNPMGDNGYRKNREAMKKALKTLRVGDRYFVLLKMRSVALGPKFEAEIGCPACSTINLVGINLDKLKITNMKHPEMKEFSGKVGEDTFKFRVLEGSHEDLLKRIRKEKKAELVTSLLFLKLIELNGEKPNLKSLKLLNSKRRNAIRDAMLNVEGGIETELEAKCNECGFAWKTELPVGQKNFFFPSGI